MVVLDDVRDFETCPAETGANLRIHLVRRGSQFTHLAQNLIRIQRASRYRLINSSFYVVFVLLGG